VETNRNHRNKVSWPRKAGAVAAAVLAMLTGATVMGETETVEAVSYKLTAAVRIRTQPSGGSAYNGVAPTGTTISLRCQQWGEAQGPNGNTLWLNVDGGGRNGWWVNDA
jgi:hypothetical protein